MMRQFAEYVMRSRRHAIIIALLCTFIPLMGWVSDVIVALVTLRNGIKEGSMVLLWVLLPSVVFALMAFPSIWIYGILGGTLTVFTLAYILHRTQSWTLVLEVGMVLGVLAVAMVHILIPDILKRTTREMLAFYNNYKSMLGPDLEPAAIHQLAVTFAKFAIGAQTVLLLIIDMTNVLIARWLQALVYNPQGFRAELQNIRVGNVSIAALLLGVIGALLGSGMATDMLPVIFLPFIAAGLSLVHDVTRLKKLSKLWLISFYAVLVLFFFYLIGIIVVVVLADHWLDFRGRVCKN